MPSIDVNGADPAVAKALAGALDEDNIFKPKEAEVKRLIAQLETVAPRDAEPVLVQFWTLLKNLGDPIADIALGINAGSGLTNNLAAFRLRSFLGDVYIRKIDPPQSQNLETHVVPDGLGRARTALVPNASWRSKQNDWVEENFRAIQVRVALMHWKFASQDKKGIKGNLDPGIIADYHHDVFDDFGLPPEAFGGTPFGGSMEGPFNRLLIDLGIWCAECDPISSR